MKHSKDFEAAQNYNLQKLDVLGHFAGGIAHDFNNILSIIEGYINMAQKRQARGEPYEEFLEKILETTHRGSGITRQLLAFGRHNIALPEVLNVKDVLMQQDVLIKPILGEDIDYHFECLDEKLCIEAAPEHIT